MIPPIKTPEPTPMSKNVRYVALATPLSVSWAIFTIIVWAVGVIRPYPIPINTAEEKNAKGLCMNATIKKLTITQAIPNENIFI